MKSVVVTVALASAFTLAACEGTSPTNADVATDDVIAHLDTATVAGLNAAIGDASGRLAPALRQAMGRSQLNGLLSDLSEQISKGKPKSALRTLALARKALKHLAELGESGGNAVDLDGISMALDQVELALQPPASPPTSQ